MPGAMAVGVSAFLQLDSQEWSAVATVVLVLVTAVYVALTARMSRAASESAKLSAAAAESAKATALAAEEANALQRAQLSIDFSVAYSVTRTSRFGSWASLIATCEASTVYFRELRVISAVGRGMSDEPLFDFAPRPTEEERAEIAAGKFRGTFCPPEPSDFPLEMPHLMHHGESVTLLFPHELLDPASSPGIEVNVVYSLTESGEARSIRRSAEVVPQVYEPGASVQVDSPT